MVIIALLCVGLLIQVAMLFVMLRKPEAQVQSAERDPLELIARARALGVTEMEYGNLKVKMEPPTVQPEIARQLTPAELKQQDEDLLLHSVRP